MKVYSVEYHEPIVQIFLQVLSVFGIKIDLINSADEVCDHSLILIPPWTESRKCSLDFDNYISSLRRKYPVANYFLFFPDSNTKNISNSFESVGVLTFTNLYELINHLSRIPPPKLDSDSILYLQKCSIYKEIEKLCHDHKEKIEFCSKLRNLKSMNIDNTTQILLEKLKKEYLNG